MYRLITESLLGLHLDVDKLRFTPCLPSEWTSFKLHYRYRETVYHITLRKTGSGSTVSRILLDGDEQSGTCVPLLDDRIDHHAEIEIA
jgi:cellobiose phosphorylase